MAAGSMGKTEDSAERFGDGMDKEGGRERNDMPMQAPHQGSCGSLGHSAPEVCLVTTSN